MSARPPITPPTIAPVDDCFEADAVEAAEVFAASAADGPVKAAVGEVEALAPEVKREVVIVDALALAFVDEVDVLVDEMVDDKDEPVSEDDGEPLEPPALLVLPPPPVSPVVADASYKI